jgi:hypothetical protein
MLLDSWPKYTLLAKGTLTLGILSFLLGQVMLALQKARNKTADKGNIQQRSKRAGISPWYKLNNRTIKTLTAGG